MSAAKAVRIPRTAFRSWMASPAPPTTPQRAESAPGAGDFHPLEVRVGEKLLLDDVIDALTREDTESSFTRY